MFSLNHIIWIIICSVISVVGVIYTKKIKPSFKTMVNICFAIGIISEIIKIFSVIELVPIEGGNGFYPYLETRYLPFHLCSLQIILFAYLKIYGRNNETTYNIISFMYPCCVIGGILAIIIPSIFNTSISVNQAFTHPLAYQTFLYHTMLIVFGIYLLDNDEMRLKTDGYKKALITIFVLGFVAININSVFTTPIYENNRLLAVSGTTNFFFTAVPPIPIAITSKWQWTLYIFVITLLAILLIGVIYLPIYLRERKTIRS